MKVSELIQKLVEFRCEHGDLMVVGRGFDETGFDKVGISDDPIMITPCTCQAHQENIDAVRHHGAYDEVRDAGKAVIFACYVDANCS